MFDFFGFGVYFRLRISTTETAPIALNTGFGAELYIAVAAAAIIAIVAVSAVLIRKRK